MSSLFLSLKKNQFKNVVCYMLAYCFNWINEMHFVKFSYFQFGVDWDVYMTKLDYTYTHIKTGDLLPYCFVPDALEEERVSQSA